jgi:hypothetical protein
VQDVVWTAKNIHATNNVRQKVTGMSEAEIMDAIKRVNEALVPFLGDDGPDQMDVQEACLALENVERVGGASSFTVAKLRRELEKRGLRKL